MGPLDRDGVLRVIRDLGPVINSDRVRIVGTASSLLRGIPLEAGDVDVLAREHEVVDQLAAAATEAGGRCILPAAWIENPGFGQYYAAFELSGARVEFSTVEPNAGAARIEECAGDAPWRYFDILELDGRRVAVVASELRLLTEITRARPDRWKPIAAYLAEHGYDEELFEAALRQLEPDLQAIMRDAIAHSSSAARRVAGESD